VTPAAIAVVSTATTAAQASSGRFCGQDHAA